MRPGSEEYLDTEKYQLPPARLGRGRADGPHASRRTCTRLNEIRARAPGAAAGCATCASTTSTTTTIMAFSKRRQADGRTTPCIVVVNLDPHGVREAHGARSTCRRWACDWDDDVRRSTTSSPAQTYSLGRAQLRPARPVPSSRRTCFAVRRRGESRGDAVTREHRRRRRPCPTRDDLRRPPGRRARPALVQARRLLRGARPRRSPTPTATAPATCAGLIEKLDYLQWLGVDCLWLPPFYASPLRDGGYDISDFTDVLPEFGTVGDFVEFVDAAHARGIRVIIDLVMNHTSDQHPWFQASRTDPDGPVRRLLRLVRQRRRGYPDARIIFVDTETSNWTFDPVRKQYFWHRFFTHQPDLNFENPAVQEAMIDALRFWLDLGIDGFRLDAVPYLFEREGTNCENLPRDARRSSSGSASEVDASTPTGCCSPRPTSGRRTSSTTSATRRPAATSATWLPLPGDAAHLHGGAPGVSATRSRRSWRRRRRSRRTASGASSCATTTS